MKQELNLSFEEAMKRLDEIAAALESGSEPLERSLELYAEGAGLIALCEKKLKDAKLTIETLFPEDAGTGADA